MPDLLTPAHRAAINASQKAMLQVYDIGQRKPPTLDQRSVTLYRKLHFRPEPERTALRNRLRAVKQSSRQRIAGEVQAKWGRGHPIPKTYKTSNVGKTDMHNRVFSKSLYLREKKASPVRVLEAGAGLGLTGWGLTHSPMVGRALAHGVRTASTRNNRLAFEALNLAESARGTMARGTARGARAARQIKAVDQAVSKVPSAIRPAVAISAGILLLGNAHPVRRTSYHPVNIRIRTGVTS